MGHPADGREQFCEQDAEGYIQPHCDCADDDGGTGVMLGVKGAGQDLHDGMANDPRRVPEQSPGDDLHIGGIELSALIKH